MADSSDSSGKGPVAVRGIDEVTAETKTVSSHVLDVIGVKGKVSKSGPGVSACEGEKSDKMFVMRHPWSLTGPSEVELRQAMSRLKEELPKSGWEIVQYGRNKSRAQSLEMTADHKKKRFSVNIEFWEKNSGGDSNPPMLVVTVVSACYQVPAGEKVDEY